MSTCKGCWGDDRVPSGPGLVMMVIGYEDGGADRPYVAHGKDEACPHHDQPHHMDECALFAAPRAGFTCSS